MQNLATYQQNLPEKVDDLAKFVIIGTEKLSALRAEIRAIRRADLAKEVYDQKIEEQNRLAALILDASVKLGEFSKQLPTAPGARTDRQEMKPNRNAAARFETKKERIEKMGLSADQVNRFEAMASHPEIVEQVKAEARERGEAPTQTEVLKRIKAANVTTLDEAREISLHKDFKRIDREHEIYKEYSDALFAILTFDDSEERVEAIAFAAGSINEEAEFIQNAITKLTTLKQKLILKGAKRCQDG